MNMERKRTNVTYEQIPKLVENAFLATEDSRFMSIAE